MKTTYREGCLVIKHDYVLDSSWEEKMGKIMKVMKFPLLVRIFDRGYITVFVDGVDLQEDKPFKPRHDIVRAKLLNKRQRKNVIKLFKDIVNTGIKTGYILADFTKRNVLIQGNNAYLIDYSVIIEKMNDDYIRLWQIMLDYLNIDYKFKGNLEELYERLN